MALSKDDLRIGNLVYKLEINNNVYRRKKLSMVDSEGNEWHRYDRELWTYSITPMKICGSVKHIIRGIVHVDSMLEDEWHLMDIPTIDEPSVESITYCGPIHLHNWNNANQFFSNKDEAIAAGERYCVNENA